MTAKIFKFPARGRKPGPVAKSVRVLLIVGQDDMREALAEALSASGFEVTPHKLDPRYYPAELLDLFTKVRFDVVIPTNLGIPFVYVPDLVSLTQKFGRGAGVIVISGWVQDDFTEELAKIPGTAFLEAPVDIDELVAKVRELTGKAESGRTDSLPRMHVLLGDAEDNQVAECFLDWLVAYYSGLRDVRGGVLDSGERILQVAAKHQVELFVLNFTPMWEPGTPFRGHMDFARHLKKKFGKPVVMLSGFAEPAYRGQALAAGVDAYFRQPLQLEEIGAVMDKLLNVRRKD